MRHFRMLKHQFGKYIGDQDKILTTTLLPTNPEF